MNCCRWDILLLCIFATGANAVSLYNYFNPFESITEGLKESIDGFTLNGIPIPIVSGSFHYFRVHPEYWRITLRKMKSAGLNTVTTYMPWNLHNPRPTIFDFGEKGEFTSEFLNIARFVEIAKDEELFVIIRPGPYIGGQWDFGGMPSWLLRDEVIQVRSLYSGFTTAVFKYYKQIYTHLNPWFYVNGGSIIAMQIENDFGYFGYNDFPREIQYLEWLRDEMDDIGFSSLLYFTSESLYEEGDCCRGSCPEVLQALNIQNNVDKDIESLEKQQPGRSYLIMDFPTGSFDYWLSGEHEQTDQNNLKTDLGKIFGYNAAFNMYMFAGGTNFGFMAGAILEENISDDGLSYRPMTTSYDFDAPLTENGDYGDKYPIITNELMTSYVLWNEIDTPDMPTERIKAARTILPVIGQLEFSEMCEQTEDHITLTNGPVNMEALDINEDGETGKYSGQSYGYILYEATIDADMHNTIQIKGHVRDMAQLFVDNKEITSKLANYDDSNSFGFWNGKDEMIEFSQSSPGKCKIQILVENLGRVSFGKPHYFDQRKGLYEGPILINGVEQLNWTAIPFEFKNGFVNRLKGWKSFTNYTDRKMPGAYLFEYPVMGTPKDIFVDTSDWQKGVIFVNGFNLGRYWTAEAPITTMYLPAPLLVGGSVNKIIVFEQYKPSNSLNLVTQPQYETRSDLQDESPD